MCPALYGHRRAFTQRASRRKTLRNGSAQAPRSASRRLCGSPAFPSCPPVFVPLLMRQPRRSPPRVAAPDSQAPPLLAHSQPYVRGIRRWTSYLHAAPAKTRGKGFTSAFHPAATVAAAGVRSPSGLSAACIDPEGVPPAILISQAHCGVVLRALRLLPVSRCGSPAAMRGGCRQTTAATPFPCGSQTQDQALRLGPSPGPSLPAVQSAGYRTVKDYFGVATRPPAPSFPARLQAG